MVSHLLYILNNILGRWIYIPSIFIRWWVYLSFILSVTFSHIHIPGIVHSYPYCIRNNQPSSSSPFNPFYTTSYSIAFNFTRNYGSWYNAYDRLPGKGSMDHQIWLKCMGPWKWDVNSLLIPDSVLRGLREYPSWPRSMRILFPFLVETIRVWFGVEEGVPRALVSTHQPALSLLGGIIASLWKPKPIEYTWHNPSLESTYQALNASDQPFQRQKRVLPRNWEKPCPFPYMEWLKLS